VIITFGDVALNLQLSLLKTGSSQLRPLIRGQGFGALSTVCAVLNTKLRMCSEDSKSFASFSDCDRHDRAR
jgi:hypothetical protein